MPNTKTSVHSLHPELLSTIFIFTIPDMAPFEACSAPLLLTQVCSSWRRIALDTPELWCKIWLDFERLDGKDILFLLDLWLDRSKRRLLDIEINEAYAGNPRKVPQFVEPLLARINLHSCRIRKLDCFCPWTFIKNLQLSSMQTLEVLTMEVTDQIPESAYIDLPSFTHLETLGLLTVSEVGEDLITASISSVQSQTQLTTLAMVVSHPQDARSLLSGLPNLRKAEFWIKKTDQHINNRPVSRMVLNELQVLEVRCRNKQEYIDPRILFDSFSTPNLKELILAFYNNDEFWDALRNFIIASRPVQLTNLDIEKTNWQSPTSPDLHLVEVLQTLPGIQSLHLTQLNVDTNILQALTRRDSHSVAQSAPNLKSLSIDKPKRFDCTAFVTMLQSRVNDLEWLYLYPCNDIPPGVLQEIRALRIPKLDLMYRLPSGDRGEALSSTTPLNWVMCDRCAFHA